MYGLLAANSLRMTSRYALTDFSAGAMFHRMFKAYILHRVSPRSTAEKVAKVRTDGISTLPSDQRQSGRYHSSATEYRHTWGDEVESGP